MIQAGGIAQPTCTVPGGLLMTRPSVLNPTISNTAETTGRSEIMSIL